MNLPSDSCKHLNQWFSPCQSVLDQVKVKGVQMCHLSHNGLHRFKFFEVEVISVEVKEAASLQVVHCPSGATLWCLLWKKRCTDIRTEGGSEGQLFDSLLLPCIEVTYHSLCDSVMVWCCSELMGTRHTHAAEIDICSYRFYYTIVEMISTVRYVVQM